MPNSYLPTFTSLQNDRGTLVTGLSTLVTFAATNPGSTATWVALRLGLDPLTAPIFLVLFVLPGQVMAADFSESIPGPTSTGISYLACTTPDGATPSSIVLAVTAATRPGSPSPFPPIT